MTDAPTDDFTAALHELDSSGDSGPICALFAEGAELHRPELDGDGAETSDPKQFWDSYAAQFSTVSTDFGTISTGDGFAALEWVSTGQLATGRDISYAGVSLLSLDDDGAISRFATYYDTAAFVVPPAG